MKSLFNKIGIVIQARMGSTRLPSKIMLPVNGQPIFQSQIERLKNFSDSLYIATTNQSADSAIVDFSIQNKIPYYRGDENNVLSRYYECASANKLDLIVRLTSDCPLIDPILITNGINQYLDIGDSSLFLSNTLVRTYPRGFDFEIFSFEMLKDAYRHVVDDSDKEHVTPYLWKNKSGKIHLNHVKRKKDASQFRLTLDTHEDFELLKLLIEVHHADMLGGDEIIKLLESNPQLALINSHIEQKKI